MKRNKIHRKLSGLHQHISSGAAHQPPPAKPPPKLPGRYHRMAEALLAPLQMQRSGTFCLKRTHYGFGYCHGQVELKTPDKQACLPLTAFAAQDTPGEVALADLVFFDTETTGLGGAGVVPFLIGCGSYTKTGFEVRQYIIPDYSDEAAMLEALMDEFSEKRTIVSYNGRAFDIPILRDRLIINRVGREVPQAGHIDLLHGTRRLYKRRLADCSLTNVERELLAFYRQEDVPGFLVPSVYFDWVGQENLDLMPGVMEHNCLDILSLAFVAEKIADAFQSDGASLVQTDDLHSLARVYGRRQQNQRVVGIYQRLEPMETERLKPDALFFHAQAFKRTGDWSQAVDVWNRLAGLDSREGYWAALELAKYFEHRVKDLPQALKQALAAAKACPYGPAHQHALKHRIKRLRRKVQQSAS